MILPVLTFMVVFLAVASGGLLLFRRRAAAERLAGVIAEGAAAPGRAVGSWRKKLKARAASLALRSGGVLPKTGEEISVVRTRLVRAGFRRESALGIFYGLKVLIPASLAGLATITGLYHYGPFFVYGITLGLGFLVPDFALGSRIKNRQEQIEAGLPDALDLMVICIEAGLGIDQAVQRVVEELKLSRPVISDELRLVLREQWAGRPRQEAWKNLADRTDVENVRSVVATIVQADQFGASVARLLRVHAESFRTRRRLEIEEQAAKTTVKLVFPLAIFIFPCLFVVALGPAVIRLVEDFVKYLGD